MARSGCAGIQRAPRAVAIAGAKRRRGDWVPCQASASIHIRELPLNPAHPETMHTPGGQGTNTRTRPVHEDVYGVAGAFGHRRFNELDYGTDRYRAQGYSP